MINVFTNGCFDILHIGHIRLLQYAKSLGDNLIVGLNSDNSIKRLKGENRPYNTELIRKEMLNSLKCVDEVIIFKEDTPIELIKKLSPDIIVKGGDYKISEVVGNDISKVVIFDTVDCYSTTNLIKKCLTLY